MLSIGELAGLAGTTVRAVRHYHAEGLLEEPERDQWGHRRYSAADLVRLLRIRRLRELGLPLDRIPQALTGDLPGLLDAFDAELAAQQEEIAERRRRIAELKQSTSDLVVPQAVEEAHRRFAEAGVHEALLAGERQAVLMMLALAPEALGELERLCRRVLDDPDAFQVWLEAVLAFQDLDAGADQADVDALADRFAAMLPRPAATGAGTAADKLLADLLRSYTTAQQRVMAAIGERLALT
ncbi:MerR family transcriptional regulator [Saccharothrix coeruleofusca]|uniref:MerR family transcriptional regulator n=1 Tax=Saccharothrix coeruleofusca TaxID=33919 RepID=A0A918AQW8_9PSEU|nr:MerR family transcriptional regulator [Saccharothrix coeruleofusca]GGP72868.1 MerR family transcriptional regulator [Saccharothrix coeruleofusca]